MEGSLGGAEEADGSLQQSDPAHAQAAYVVGFRDVDLEPQGFEKLSCKGFEGSISLAEGSMRTVTLLMA